MGDWKKNQTIGKYTILDKIGEGGMAEVFLARSKGAGGIDKMLVLKRIHPVLAKNARFIEMFMEEARVAMRLNHSNIVQVYAFDQVDEDFVLAMELVDGSDLLRIQTLAFHENKRIPFGLCAFIAQEIAKGLDYAHQKKDEQGFALDLVHRDVSPQNVLISRDGAVKVTDFGIVKARWADEEVGEVKGKLGYMSPQQARGLAVDRRADIFSLGVVLHEMLVGATRDKPKIGEVVTLDPPIAVDPTVPERLSEITMKALAPDPEDRYQSAREMAIDLAGFLKGIPGLFDTTTLEEWIASAIPEEKLVGTKVKDASTTQVSTVLEEQTINMHVIGEFERQAAQLVTVQISAESGAVPDEISRQFHRLLTEIAYKTGGIARYVDQTGQLFLGIPTSSFEDPILAIRVANDLRDVVQGLAIDHQCALFCRIAINHGQVKIAKEQVEGQFYFEPEPTLVEAATRFIEHCPADVILADAGVNHVARTDYQFGPKKLLGQQAEDGESDRDPLSRVGYPVLGPLSRAQRNHSTDALPDDVVGRHREMQRLQDILDRSKDGMASIVRLSGALGLGKSSLLRAFGQQAKKQGASVLRAECLFSERDIPLGAAAAVLRTLLGVEETLSPGALKSPVEKLFESAPAYGERQQRFFEQLLRAPQSLFDRTVDKRELIRRTAFSIGVILTLLAHRRTVVLVVDNGQWLDGPSVDVLSELARNLLSIPVMVILAGQPEMLAYRHIDNLEDIPLPELSPQAIKSIVTGRIGRSPDINEITEQIVARAHGNPFFANEIVDSLIFRGIIKQRGYAADGTPRFVQVRAGVIHLPATVKGIADARINTLSPEQRTVLRAASVIGGDFTEKEIQYLVNPGTPVNLNELVDAGFLQKVDRGPEVAFTFQRAVEREAAYDGLSRADGRQLHQKMARRLMKKSDSGRPVPPVRIAWHLDKSDQAELAADYYLKAADAAMAVYSSRRALRLVDRALALLPRSSKGRYQVLLRKERLIRDIGLHQIHRETIDEMADLGKRFEDASMQATAAYRLARYHYYDGRFDEAASQLELSMRLARRSGDHELQVESLRALGYVAVELGALDAAMDCCRWAHTLVDDTAKNQYLLARVLGLEGLILMERGQLDEAAYPLCRAMITFQRIGDKRNESVELANLGLLAQARGFLLEALSFFEHALSLDREIRDVSERGRKLVGLADIRVELGQFDLGRSLLDEALNICRKNAEPIGEFEAMLGTADMLLQRQEPGGALDILENLRQEPFLQTSQLARARHLRLLADGYIMTGATDQAIASARQAVQIAARAKMDAERLHGLSLQCLALAIADDKAGAIEMITGLLREMDRTMPIRHAERVWWRLARATSLLKMDDAYQLAKSRAKAEVYRKVSLIGHPKHKARYKNHPLVAAIL